jgi:hypothetical protein
MATPESDANREAGTKAIATQQMKLRIIFTFIETWADGASRELLMVAFVSLPVNRFRTVPKI